MVTNFVIYMIIIIIIIVIYLLAAVKMSFYLFAANLTSTPSLIVCQILRLCHHTMKN